MELVYLWVKDYKNIQKQGFNFSPRFTCNYDDVKNELTIDENDDYIENFFGDNINVTAIVGKNGSGKSSILESLLEIIVGIENKKIIETESKYILLYDNKYISNIDKMNIESCYTKTTVDFFTISLDYALDTFTNDIYRSESHYKYEDNKKYILEPNKFSQNKANINLDIDAEKMNKRIIAYQNSLDNDLLRDTIFVPNKIIIRLDPRRIFYKDKGKQNKLGSHFLKIEATDYFTEIKKLNDVFITSYNDKYINNKEYNKAKENVNNFLDKLEYVFTGNEFKMGRTANIKTQKGIELEFSKLDSNFKKLLGALPRYFLLDFETYDNLNYTDLSTGEKHLQKLIYTVIDYCLQSKEKNILVIIDEIELYLHPQWQKNYINILVNSLEKFLKKYDKKIHFLLTTHSTFVISDLLKQNIIFLDRYKENDDEVKKGIQKEGNCKVVDGLNNKKETFGQNIHTLLSDSFFMEDGLMGEFAKGKINEIIRFHKEVEEENKNNLEPLQVKYKEVKTKFWNTQSIIGDEYLKQVIKNYLVDMETILLGHDAAREAEIERLRAEADRLENLS